MGETTWWWTRENRPHSEYALVRGEPKAHGIYWVGGRLIWKLAPEVFARTFPNASALDIGEKKQITGFVLR